MDLEGARIYPTLFYIKHGHCLFILGQAESKLLIGSSAHKIHPSHHIMKYHAISDLFFREADAVGLAPLWERVRRDLLVGGGGGENDPLSAE